MSEQKLKDVRPINTRTVDGRTLKERYKFGAIFISDIPRDFSQKNVDFKKGRDKIRWQYSGKCPILITAEGVKAKESSSTTEAQNQAYFALSILADDGYVSHWEKV